MFYTADVMKMTNLGVGSLSVTSSGGLAYNFSSNSMGDALTSSFSSIVADTTVLDIVKGAADAQAAINAAMNVVSQISTTSNQTDSAIATLDSISAYQLNSLDSATTIASLQNLAALQALSMSNVSNTNLSGGANSSSVTNSSTVSGGNTSTNSGVTTVGGVTNNSQSSTQSFGNGLYNQYEGSEAFIDLLVSKLISKLDGVTVNIDNMPGTDASSPFYIIGGTP